MVDKQPQPEKRSAVGRLLAVPRAIFAATLGRLSIRMRIALLVGGLMVAANLTFVLTWINVKPKTEGVVKHDYLTPALEALDHGAYGEAKRLAALARDQGSIDQAESGGPSYVLGAVTAMEADTLWEEDQRRYYLLAARHLEEANRRGFPAGREAEGQFLLGKSLCLSREYISSRAVLEQALKSNPQRSGEIHWLLARAYLWGTPPDLKMALDHNEKYLADDQLSRRERFEGLLIKGQILLKGGHNDECLKVLSDIPHDAPSSADANVLRGQLLMQAADKMKAELSASSAVEARRAVQQKYREAIDTLRLAQNRGSSAERVVPQSMYLVGECFLSMDDSRAALDQFSRTRQLYGDRIEGIAAAFQEADLLRRLNRDEEAIAAYRRAVTAVGDPSDFRNPLLSLENIRQRLFDAYQSYIKSGHFDRAVDLTGVLFPLMSRERQVELTAQAHRDWAASLGLEADRSSTADGRELARQARAQWRQAGDAYRQLAELRLSSRAYPDDVWHSAEAYQSGHNFRGAVKMLDEYLRYELRRGRPRALLDLGESQLALEDFGKSLEACNECITSYPSDAASYRARWVAAKAHMEKGENEEAEKLLRENLEGGDLTPKSLEWRDSLYTFGWLLQTEGRDEEAIPRLEEFVERYPDSQQLIQARYLIAEAYRRSARIPREKLDNDTIETSRIAHNKQMQQLLSAAIVQYEQVQDILTRHQEQMELDPLEQAILRNCYFARGVALYDMGRYDEAIRAYSAATNHYQHQPEVLEALMQIAACYRRLGRPDEARGTLEQAKVMFTRIKADAPFTETTNYSRDEWAHMLEWYASL